MDPDAVRAAVSVAVAAATAGCMTTALDSAASAADCSSVVGAKVAVLW